MLAICQAHTSICLLWHVNHFLNGGRGQGSLAGNTLYREGEDREGVENYVKEGGDLRLVLTGQKKHCKTGVCLKMKVCPDRKDASVIGK